MTAAYACDGRGAEAGRTVRLTLLGTTDLHGYVLPYDYATGREAPHGLARVGTLVDSVRQTDPHVLLFDSGDLLQGAPLVEFQARVGADPVHPMIAAMNRLGYTAAVPGNHEFNYGLDFLRGALDDAAFPFLAANVYDAESGEPAFPPFVVRETGGVRVAIIGFTTPGAAIWDRAHLEGRLRFADIVESARRWLPSLIAEEPDLLVAVAHSGLGPGSSYAPEAGVPEENAIRRLLEEVPEIQVAFIGHTHRPMHGERVGEALVVQAGRFGDHLAVAHVILERQGDRWRVADRKGDALRTADVAPSPALEEIVRDAHRRTLAWLDEPIGWTPDRWSAARARFEDTPLADLVTHVQRELTGAELAATSVFDTRAEFGPGPITRRDILGVYIYPNTLKAVRLSGDALREYLEWSARYFAGYPGERLISDSIPGYNFDVVSGVSYAIDIRRPPGSRILELEYRGRPVSPTDSLTVAVHSYRQSGGGGATMVADAPLVYSDERTLPDLLVEWVRARDTVRTADVFEANWRLLPEEAVARFRADPTATSGR